MTFSRSQVKQNRDAAIAAGQPHYFGRPCRKHPDSLRRTSDTHCEMCMIERASSPQQRERSREWRASNLEAVREQDRLRAEASRKEKPEHHRAVYKRSYASRKRRDPVRIRGASREAMLKGKYGITSADYSAMFFAQNGKCAICGKPPGEGPLDIDHCHKTGKVRGLLCRLCNTAIGKLGDDFRVIYRAALYLIAHGGTEA